MLRCNNILSQKKLLKIKNICTKTKHMIYFYYFYYYTSILKSNFFIQNIQFINNRWTKIINVYNSFF